MFKNLTKQVIWCCLLTAAITGRSKYPFYPVIMIVSAKLLKTKLDITKSKMTGSNIQ